MTGLKQVDVSLWGRIQVWLLEQWNYTSLFQNDWKHTKLNWQVTEAWYHWCDMRGKTLEQPRWYRIQAARLAWRHSVAWRFRRPSLAQNNSTEALTLLWCTVVRPTQLRCVYCLLYLERMSKSLWSSGQRSSLLNARLVGNKSASVQRWIVELKLNIVAWHDNARSPDLITCTPPDFQMIEQGWPRSN